MADKASTGKRQTKKLNSAQMSVLFGPHAATGSSGSQRAGRGASSSYSTQRSSAGSLARNQNKVLRIVDESTTTQFSKKTSPSAADRQTDKASARFGSSPASNESSDVVSMDAPRRKKTSSASSTRRSCQQRHRASSSRPEKVAAMPEAVPRRPSVSQPLSSPTHALEMERQDKMEQTVRALASLTQSGSGKSSFSPSAAGRTEDSASASSPTKMKSSTTSSSQPVDKTASSGKTVKDAGTDSATSPFSLPQAKMPDPLVWNENFARIARHSHHLLRDFASRQQKRVGTHLLSADIASSFIEMTGRMMTNPMGMMSAQVSLWQGYMDVWQNSARRFFGNTELEDVVKPERSDRRFKDKAWQENPVFDHIKQSYLLTSRWLQEQVHNVDGLAPEARKKLDFYTRQYVDAMSPSNFVATNPQVLRTTLETGGENLLKGLENLLKDMEAGRIRMTDETAFEVGKNIATTRGEVVYQNDLIQLIQYAPTTPNVAQVPLLIVPPWINKFYILDLKAENSFIQWAVDQGLTVFCISWVNPDARLAELGFEDYMESGVLAAIEEVKKLSCCDEVNTIGYCLGGTLLASTLAYLHATDKKLARSVRSATYFVTMLDFQDPGELGVFIDETQLKMIEQKMFESGFLDAANMATSFSMLRANDLIWSFVVNNYLLGKEPFPFDLLYWNSDSTRMPAKMHSFYLRNMYQNNRLAEPGGISLKGVPIDLSAVTTPSYFLSAREDHITPWESTYRGTQIFGGPVTFTLSGSGHIAGVVNPPVAKKYNYWSSDELPETPQVWLENAQENAGSWWPHWREWLNLHSGDQVKAREVADSIEPAPGSYVKVRAV